ncbi:TetR/AcrR family transcriptional regulator [Clostridium baratii]|uniref:TetR/AcrR family transcriptional regulator n=1 Tax=Clostridium baratii TaxID=1561 RepID=UPI00290663D7|nr:TetR/AcrR family transcriptional regulator [Clostridium baratii]MDU4910185.1 TetR/AcrR family transcriptional regulator [Clostridium baratii]
MPKILENPRDKILTEARVMIKEYGYEKLSMRKLAKACDIGIGTLYNYFKNKHSIVIEIVRIDWEVSLNRLERVTEFSGTFEEKMKFIYDELENYLYNHIDIFILLYNEEKTKPNHFNNNIFGSLYVLTDEIIDYHKENGELKINLDTRNLSKFIVSNMITIIKSHAFSFDDLMCILIKK